MPWTSTRAFGDEVRGAYPRAVEDVFVDVVGGDPLRQGLVAGLVIAAFNLAGALAVLVWRDPSEKWVDAGLAFAAGIMLSAAYTSLLVPGAEFAAAPGYDAVEIGGLALTGVTPVLVGLFAGVAVLSRGETWARLAGRLVSGRLVDAAGSRSDDRRTDGGTETVTASGESNARLTAILVFVVAITLHNVPEGLAVGVTFGSGDVANAVALMLAIGIQNVPEGFAVSVAAVSAGLSGKWYAAIAGLRAGLVEIPVAVFGAWAVTVAAPLLPYGMGFAAGGMIFVIVDEIVPETYSAEYGRLVTVSLMVGVALMFGLDVALE